MRADIYLVTHGYFESRAKAQVAIKAGGVTINGRRIRKPSETIGGAASVTAKSEHPWVSRGGLKLDHALTVFGVSVEGKTCLDVGSATGGFTDVLLARGAAKVYAVDVGTDQLHTRLKTDARVISWENTDARSLSAEMFDPLPRVIVCDASFISAMKVLAIPLALVPPGTQLITLVKPQFEVGKDGIGKGGIVKSESLALQALSDVSAWVTAQGWQVIKTDTSPIKGGSGNTEYLLWAEKRPPKGSR